jgi:hypothetical protein
MKTLKCLIFFLTSISILTCKNFEAEDTSKVFVRDVLVLENTESVNNFLRSDGKVKVLSIKNEALRHVDQILDKVSSEHLISLSFFGDSISYTGSPRFANLDFISISGSEYISISGKLTSSDTIPQILVLTNARNNSLHLDFIENKIIDVINLNWPDSTLPESIIKIKKVAFLYLLGDEFCAWENLSELPEISHFISLRYTCILKKMENLSPSAIEYEVKRNQTRFHLPEIQW